MTRVEECEFIIIVFHFIYHIAFSCVCGHIIHINFAKAKKLSRGCQDQEELEFIFNTRENISNLLKNRLNSGHENFNQIEEKKQFRFKNKIYGIP